jgi:hypothetical protein
MSLAADFASTRDTAQSRYLRASRLNRSSGKNQRETILQGRSSLASESLAHSPTPITMDGLSHTHTHTHTHTSVFTTKPMCYTTKSVIYFKIRQDIISKWRQEKKFSENPIYHKTLHSSLKSYCSRSEGRATCILARVKEFPPDSIEIPGLPA